MGNYRCHSFDSSKVLRGWSEVVDDMITDWPYGSKNIQSISPKTPADDKTRRGSL